MDGGQVWPSEPESGTDYAGARGGRFRKFLKGSVGKLRVLPAGTRSGVGMRHGLRGAPPQDMGRRRHAAWARGTPPSGTWGDVGTRHGLRGAPQPRAAGSPCRMQSDVGMGHKLRGAPPRAAERHCHEARAAGSTPRTWGDVGTRHGCREHPQAAGSPRRMQSDVSTGHELRGSPPSPLPGMRSGVGKRARPGLGADARHRHRRRLSADPRATASSAPKT